MINKLDIIFFGDSLTFGYGVNKNKCWVNKIANSLQINYLNKACNGDTTTSMLSRYYNDVLKYKPLNIFIMCGTNDLLLRRSSQSIIDNIEIMIKDALNIKANPIIGIPPQIISTLANKAFSESSVYDYCEKELIKLKNALISLCEKYKIKFIDFYELTVNDYKIYLDGIHLNELGHNSMYQLALKSISNLQ